MARQKRTRAGRAHHAADGGVPAQSINQSGNQSIRQALSDALSSSMQMLMLMRCSTRSKCCAVRSEAPGLQCGCAWSKSRTRALKVRWVPLSGRYHAPVRHEAARLARQLASQQRGDNSGPPGGDDGKWYNRDACDTASYSCRTPSHQFARPAVSWAVLAAPKRLRLASKRTTAHPSPFFPRRTCSRAPTHS